MENKVTLIIKINGVETKVIDLTEQVLIKKHAFKFTKEKKEILFDACKSGKLEMVKLLFEQGLTANDARADDNNALRLAYKEGYLDVVQFLLSFYVKDLINSLNMNEKCFNVVIN